MTYKNDIPLHSVSPVNHHYRKSGSAVIWPFAFMGPGNLPIPLTGSRLHSPIIRLLPSTFPFMDKPYGVKDLNALLMKCLRSSGSARKSARPFGLMGYSMGGRLCLPSMRPFPLGSGIFLIAPDGLKVNAWYWFATQTLMGKRIFSYTMRNPAWFNGLLQAGRKSGFVNESIMKFVHRYIDDTGMREKVYQGMDHHAKVYTPAAQSKIINQKKTDACLPDLWQIRPHHNTKIWRTLYSGYRKVVPHGDPRSRAPGIASAVC